MTRIRHTPVIEVRPESLSFNYIANSTVIRFFTDLGINLEPFYKLLWRHVLAVEVLQHHFSLKDSEANDKWMSGFFRSQQTKRKKQQSDDRQRKALEYLRTFGNEFWQQTETRTREIASTFEQEMRKGFSASLGATGSSGPISISPNVAANREHINKLTAEERADIIHRGQEVINKVQVRELDDIFALLNGCLDEFDSRYIITIDRLDDAWVEESVRYRLIRALIDTVREFRKVAKVKVIISLRQDLLERVFRATRDSGFQEEKFRSLYLPVSWTKEQLIDLVDTRIGKLVKDRHTKAKITHRDILSGAQIKIEGKNVDPLDYMLARTWMRPRDIIEFVNLCINQARGKSALTTSMIQTAEGEYSRLRFRSLVDEWKALHPHLDYFLSILKKRSPYFRLADLGDTQVADCCLEFVIQDDRAPGHLAAIARAIVDGGDTPHHFRATLAHVFYRVGVCGLKTETYQAVQWAEDETTAVSPSDISDETIIHVHPALWRVLGIVPKR